MWTTRSSSEYLLSSLLGACAYYTLLKREYALIKKHALNKCALIIQTLRYTMIVHGVFMVPNFVDWFLMGLSYLLHGMFHGLIMVVYWFIDHETLSVHGNFMDCSMIMPWYNSWQDHCAFIGFFIVVKNENLLFFYEPCFDLYDYFTCMFFGINRQEVCWRSQICNLELLPGYLLWDI